MRHQTLDLPRQSLRDGQACLSFSTVLPTVTQALSNPAEKYLKTCFLLEKYRILWLVNRSVTISIFEHIKCKDEITIDAG